MYESFFEFSSRPFLATPQVEGYYAAAGIEEARQTLVRVVERAEGPGLLIGPPGTGKSLMCQVLAAQFRRTFRVALLTSARLCTRRALLQAILYELGMSYRGMEEGELRLSLIDHIASPEAKAGMLLLVDEAHVLPLRLLEEIRMISNLVSAGEPRVRVVLAGSHALDERFAHPKLESFHQRIAARCYLSGFDQNETSEYVRAQVAACGGTPETSFTDDALAAVHHASGGIPRLINQVCDHALVLAAASGVRPIDVSGVEEAWADLQQLPVPLSAGDAAKDGESDSGVIEFGSLDDLPHETAQESEDAPLDEVPQAVSLHRPEAAESPQDTLEELTNTAEIAGVDAGEGFQPIGTIGPKVGLAFRETPNPFSEDFDQDEVVIDRYATVSPDVLRGRPNVSSLGDDQLADMLRPPHADHDQPPLIVTAAPAPPAHATDSAPDAGQWHPSDDPVMPEENDDSGRWGSAVDPKDASEIDRPLLVVDEEPMPAAHPVTPVRRKAYRQLFAKLRHG